MAFDFGVIAPLVSNIMDGDYIDIRRNVDGSLTEVYSNVPCHIAYVSIDNPDPTSVDTKPIVQAIRVHVPLWVDVRNDDFLVAKKMGSDGTVVGAYSGRCGNPVVSQGRKKVLMQMSSTEVENPTPTPPTDTHRIYVMYMSSDTEISPKKVYEVEDGGSLTISPMELEGYLFSYMSVDGVWYIEDEAVLDDVTEDHTVVFQYRAVDIPQSFRFLVNGLYTKDDGTLANGWHAYRSLPIMDMSVSDGVYTIECEDFKLEHRDNGRILSIEPSTLLVLADGTFASVDRILERDGGTVRFEASEFTPTSEQASYYRTRWYDV